MDQLRADSIIASVIFTTRSPSRPVAAWLAADGDRALEVLDLGHVIRQQPAAA